MSFVREVWFGQRSLAQTYWVWGTLLGGVVIGGFSSILSGPWLASTQSIFPYTLFFALAIPHGIWIWVGLWRCATNNPGRWATIVKVLLIIGIPIQGASWMILLMNSSGSLFQ